MPNKTIYITKDRRASWDAAQLYAKKHGISLSEVVHRAMREWVEKKEKK